MSSEDSEDRDSAGKIPGYSAYGVGGSGESSHYYSFPSDSFSIDGTNEKSIASHHKSIRGNDSNDGNQSSGIHYYSFQDSEKSSSLSEQFGKSEPSEKHKKTSGSSRSASSRLKKSESSPKSPKHTSRSGFSKKSSSDLVKPVMFNKPLISLSALASPAIAPQELTFTKKIGEGGFGEVWLGEWYGQPVAIKNLKLEATSPELEDELKKEAQIMVGLRNPTIVMFYGLCLEKTKCLVIEFMPKGALNSFLKKKSIEELSWRRRYVIAKDVAEGLSYLHNQNPQIIHRDLKSHNVLLTNEYRAKLADFGLAYEKIKSEALSKTTLPQQNEAIRGVGTLCWMAPELLSFPVRYTSASDIYAYGILLWEMATHKIPYAGASATIISTLIKNGEREKIPQNIPERAYAKMIEQCWAKKAEARLTTTEVKEILEGLISKSSQKTKSIKKGQKKTTLDNSVQSESFSTYESDSSLLSLPEKPSLRENVAIENQKTKEKSAPKKLPSTPKPKTLPTMFSPNPEIKRPEIEIKKGEDQSADLILAIKSYCQRLSTSESFQEDLSLYVPINGKFTAHSTSVFSLHDHLKLFIAGNKELLLLLGESGGGKSLFGQALVQQLAQTYQTGDPIPFFVSLPTLREPKTRLMEEILLRHGFSENSFAILKKSHRFFLVLDAYDELNLQENFYRRNNLDQWQVKIMMTCRTSYLTQFASYQSFFVPFKIGNARHEAFEELYVAPFSATQIDSYIHQYLNTKQEEGRIEIQRRAEFSTDWLKPETYLMWINQIPGLSTLVHNPFLLKITIQVLPNIVAQYQETQNQQERFNMTSVKLYDAFITHWFARQEEKLMGLDLHPGRSLHKDYMAFTKALAKKMHEKHLTQVIYSDESDMFGEKAASEWDMFFSNDFVPSDRNDESRKNLRILARKGCPLRKVATDQYAFIHASLLDYFISLIACDSPLMKIHNQPEKALPKLTGESHHFFQSLPKSPQLTQNTKSDKNSSDLQSSQSENSVQQDHKTNNDSDNKISFGHN